MKHPYKRGYRGVLLYGPYTQLVFSFYMLIINKIGLKGYIIILVINIVWDIILVFVYFIEGEYIFDETGFVKKNLYYKKRISYNEFKTIQYIALPAMSEKNAYRLGYDIVRLVFADIPLELKYDIDYIR